MLAALGFAGGIENATLSRLHVRGNPGEIDQDLVLYASGLNDDWQQDYVQTADYMDAYFRACGADEIEGAESCPEPDYDPPTSEADDAVEDTDDGSRSSGLCASGTILPLLLFSMAAARRRRL